MGTQLFYLVVASRPGQWSVSVGFGLKIVKPIETDMPETRPTSVRLNIRLARVTVSRVTGWDGWVESDWMKRSKIWKKVEEIAILNTEINICPIIRPSPSAITNKTKQKMQYMKKNSNKRVNQHPFFPKNYNAITKPKSSPIFPL